MKKREITESEKALFDCVFDELDARLPNMSALEILAIDWETVGNPEKEEEKEEISRHKRIKTERIRRAKIIRLWAEKAGISDPELWERQAASGKAEDIAEVAALPPFWGDEIHPDFDPKELNQAILNVKAGRPIGRRPKAPKKLNSRETIEMLIPILKDMEKALAELKAAR